MSENTRTVIGSSSEALKLRQYRLTPKQTAFGSALFQKRLVHLGSHPDCEFCIQDPSVSRQHAKIEIDAHGFRFVDLGSKNGCFVGDLRVNDIYLNAPMTFRLGAVEINFELGASSVEIPIYKGNKFGNLIGQSLPMREIFGTIERIAPSPMTVLIEGESGCGKELVAEAIHRFSERADKPFVIFDCSAVSKDLIESELFGHERGAFTGAVNKRKGAFLQAQGGTIFLDEIGELALDLQPKLLRVLENHELRPVGGEKTIPLDVRIIAATNRQLQREVEAGQFREDLFYRLAVIKLNLVPLRKRSEDIPLLVEHFLEEVSKKFQRPPAQLSFSTLQKLKSYPWPGNVRELKNFVERAAILSNDNRLETRFLNVSSDQALELPKAMSPKEGMPAFIQEVLSAGIPFRDAKQRLIESFELAYWKRLLERCSGNISQAAREAAIHRKSAEYIVRKLDLIANDVSKLDD